MNLSFDHIARADRRKLKPNAYYCVSDDHLDNVDYGTISGARHSDVYVMREFLDRKLRDFHHAQLNDQQRYYAANGYLILRDFIPADLIDEYLKLREKAMIGNEGFPKNTVPHADHQSIRDIACYKPLLDVIESLHSMRMGLIFSLTQFTSTQRGWHQDSYLDDDFATPRCASWIALGDVNADCGPFEYISGSHKWNALSNQKINEKMGAKFLWPDAHTRPSDGTPRWGKLSERFISPSVERKITNEGHKVSNFTASKGDVLIWYARLMHQGSAPKVEGAQRPALISHYTPVGEKGRGLFVKRNDGGHFLLPPRLFDNSVNYDDAFVG